ncbi:hypothetical protein EYF80_032538 [Liparis tanakae]|uniref:Uncharacterized protein n=1 Tax=Liparis tanakae TaxID=230148 RepID=A0A4Z2GX80_9TELE|nr:hypothetical protein EYF80_032538 [Liparis tanakae]
MSAVAPPLWSIDMMWDEESAWTQTQMTSVLHAESPELCLLERGAYGEREGRLAEDGFPNASSWRIFS